MSKKVIIFNKYDICDILTCPICLEYYNFPRILFCGHSYCTKCLYTLTINNKIICPLCRYSNILEEQNINDLPINSTLISLIDSKNFQNNNIKKYKKPLKKSKSVDCLIYPKKFKNTKTIYTSRHIENVKCFNDIEYEYDNNYCCFQ